MGPGGFASQHKDEHARSPVKYSLVSLSAERRAMAHRLRATTVRPTETILEAAISVRYFLCDSLLPMIQSVVEWNVVILILQDAI